MLLRGGNRLLKSQLQLPMLNHPDWDDVIDTTCDDINWEQLQTFRGQKGNLK